MLSPVCGIVHIKEPLLLIVKSSPYGGSGFPLSVSEWSFAICLMPYNHKYNVLSALLNKMFPSFLSSFAYLEVRCSSVVRVFAHGVIGHGIVPLWWTH